MTPPEPSPQDQVDWAAEWTIPADSTKIHIGALAFEVLHEQFRGGITSEQTGLLLGNRTSGTPAMIEVSECQALTDRGVAPGTPAMDELVAELLTLWPPALDTPMSVLGYYCIRGKTGGRLSREEAVWLEQHFPAPATLVLVITPAERGASASVFLRETGEEWSNKPSLHVKLPWTEALVRIGRVTTKTLVRQPDLTPAPLPVPLAALPTLDTEAPPAAPPRWAMSWSGIALLCLTVGSIGWWLGFGHVNGAAKHPASLQVKVERRDGYLEVIWNPPPIGATATLLVEDGQEHREISLDAQETSRGHMSYAPQSSEITLSLEVRKQQGSAERETVKVFGVPAPAGNSPRMTDQTAQSINAGGSLLPAPPLHLPLAPVQQLPAPPEVSVWPTNPQARTGTPGTVESTRVSQGARLSRPAIPR